MSRRLLTTRRRIPLDRLEEYLADWREVRRAVRAAGGHAWLFRGEEREDRFLEFVESDVSIELAAEPRVAEARETLEDGFGQEWSDVWTEAPEGADDGE